MYSTEPMYARPARHQSSCSACLRQVYRLLLHILGCISCSCISWASWLTRFQRFPNLCLPNLLRSHCDYRCELLSLAFKMWLVEIQTQVLTLAYQEPYLLSHFPTTVFVKFRIGKILSRLIGFIVGVQVV